MNHSAKIGLLPLYLALYDKTDPGRRGRFGPFLSQIASAFERAEVDVVRADICCVQPEFRRAVERFERESVELIVAVHLAYSPSLESADALAASPLPLLFLDTTMDYAFGPDVDPSRISYNHGIHGVQDLASVLRKRGKPFEIVAGHVTESDVLDMAVNIALAAHAARLFRTTKALRIGAPFAGMGDFAVPDDLMKEVLGITVHQIMPDVLAAEIATLSKAEIDAERTEDCERFDVVADEAVHRRSLQVSLALRRLLDRGNYTAFSMNFLAFDSSEGPVNTPPFLEASKAMARSTGYGGEGDVLTASLVGALAGSFGGTSFTEIFCPDWKENSIFLSHMGEINPLVVAGRPRLIELDFPYTNALNPAVAVGGFAPGAATLVNLAPGPNDTFGLIAAAVEVLEEPAVTTMGDCIRGWIRPDCPLAIFLEEYSRWGGTHHSALVYGHRVAEIEAYARFAGLQMHVV